MKLSWISIFFFLVSFIYSSCSTSHHKTYRSPSSQIDRLNCHELISNIANQRKSFSVELVHRYESTTTATNRSVVAFDKITPKNFHIIFTHLYDEQSGFYGAKAIHYQLNNNQSSVVFWPTGNGRTGNNIHHRDALASTMELEAKSYLEEENEELWVKTTDELEHFVTIGRSHESYSDDLLKRSAGFQFSAKGGKIIFLDMDSSMTSAQVDRKITLSTSFIINSLKAMIKRISPQVSNLRNIRIKGLKRMIDNNLIDQKVLQSEINKALEEQGLKKVKIIDLFNRRNRFSAKLYKDWSSSSVEELLSFIKLRSRSRSFALSTISSN